MSRTIPRSLLPHRVDHQAAETTPDGTTFGTAIILPARFEQRTKIVYTGEGRSAAASGLVFLPPHVGLPDPDPTVTDPVRVPVEPQVGDRITHRTRRYRVLEVTTLANIDGSAHHHEVWVG